ncbi:FKBP-type peptidyl-prolyl cis-trans isomerase [Oleiphilus messinensis]|uniref:Peptidyl-prolyl cis-trans isomerase n=1 Tax=Oleiphilus messinensis TaxID=141451 RepID=A0A1Y0I3V0_9GAMM|nr:FKBP-type peptidyl-prolyl cis-trans isomerase [Oleiphilus messinensis]ARU54205.1 FKBP-type peptidyl-prolyl cis-trans isomerase [Oleiphilus messinensis]
MKKLVLAAALSTMAVSGFTVSAANAEEIKLDSDEKKVSYGFGAMLGKRMKNDMPSLDVDAFVKGMTDGYSGGKVQLSDAEIGQVIQEFQMKQREAQMAEFEHLATENKTKGDAFLAKNKGKDGVITTESGLQYKVLKAGSGSQPAAEDKVKVHYEGSLIDGTVFDSSIKRGEPVTFPVGGVISGWTEALQLMKEGAKWQLYIPADLAYGPGGNRNIGPNEVLLFDVELLEVQKN